MLGKPKIGMYWASSCGGCEIALVNIHERLLDIDANFDLAFCPCLMDVKKKDVEALPDKDVAITFFNGAIRNGENEEMAHLLRRKSGLLVAFGSCASWGSIPALANLQTAAAILKTAYVETPSTGNPSAVMPRRAFEAPEGTLRIPSFHEKVKTLSQVTEVDYFIPGCPPESPRIWDVIDHVVQGKPLPPKGSVLGAGSRAVCSECERKKEDKRIKRFHRTHEISPDREKCLLEQGIVCMGIATREGCGALCPKVNMPCMGCYGPPEGVPDQGAGMIAALGSVLDLGEGKLTEEDLLTKNVDEILASLPDPTGTFYKFSLAGSILKGKSKITKE